MENRFTYQRPDEQINREQSGFDAMGHSYQTLAELLQALSQQEGSGPSSVARGLMTDFPMSEGQPIMQHAQERRYGRPEPTMDWSLRGTNPMKGNYRVTGTYRW